MLRCSLLAGLVAVVALTECAAPANADNGSNSVRIAVNVAPDSTAQRDDDSPASVGSLDTGSAMAVALVAPRVDAGFPAGEAVAGDDGPSDTGHADSVADALAATTVAAAPAATLAASGSADASCGVGGCMRYSACPCYYADVEAVFLQQEPRYYKQPLLIDDISGNVLQTTAGLGFFNDPGVRATFGMRTCGCRAVEFTYFGLFRNGTTTVFQNPDPNNIVLTFPTGSVGNVFLDMDRVQTSYSTYLNSFELNFPCCCGCCTQSCGCSDSGCGSGCGESGCGEATCGGSTGNKCGRSNVCCRSVEWFAGFRYIEFGSDLDINAQAYPPPFTETGEYAVHTINRLFGAQIGGRIRQTYNRFGLELTGAAGIYDNDATQSQTVIDYPNFPLRPTTSAQANYAAFEGELNLSGIYRLNNVWNVKAGYSLIWIEGLALAPDQLDFNFATSPSGNQLSAAGGMFLHGANVGLEARW